MVRRNSSPLSGLSDAEIKRLAVQLRAALKDVFGDAEAERVPASPAPGTSGRTGRRTEDLRPPEQRNQPPRHITFSPGVTTIAARGAQQGRVFNSSAAVDAAWARLAATAAELERERGRRDAREAR